MEALTRANPWAELWFCAEEGDAARMQEVLTRPGAAENVNAKDAAGESALIKVRSLEPSAQTRNANSVLNVRVRVQLIGHL